MLELLECLKRSEAWILIIQTYYKSKVHTIIVEVVQETAAISFAVQWPAGTVLDQSRFYPTWWQLPEFLEAQTECGRGFICIKLEALNQLLRQ